MFEIDLGLRFFRSRFNPLALTIVINLGEVFNSRKLKIFKQKAFPLTPKRGFPLQIERETAGDFSGNLGNANGDAQAGLLRRRGFPFGFIRFFQFHVVRDDLRKVFFANFSHTRHPARSSYSGHKHNIHAATAGGAVCLLASCLWQFSSNLAGFLCRHVS
jgi:hypothetical protein